MEKQEAIRKLATLMRTISCRPQGFHQALNSRGENACLMMIYTKKDCAQPSEIAESCGVSTARIAAALKQMEKKGWVNREVDKDDRRKVLVTLTEEGKVEAERSVEEIKKSWLELVEILGDEDTETLIRIMTKISEFADSKYLEEMQRQQRLVEE